jgi:hypothetical protein
LNGRFSAKAIGQLAELISSKKLSQPLSPGELKLTVRIGASLRFFTTIATATSPGMRK